MTPLSKETGAKPLSFLQEYMTMWNINVKEALHFWRLAGRTATVSSLLPLTCFLLPAKVTVIRKSRVALTTAQMAIKAGVESMMAKTDAAVLLIKRALNAGIRADYVLMDTWFTTEPMIKAVLKEGLDVIGMVKQLKQHYNYRGKAYILPQLQKFVRFEGPGNIFGSLAVTTKTGIPVKLVFVRNRNKKSECLYLLSTDCSLSDAEIVRIYGNRWSIECFFKASKSFMKLGTEFQSRSFDAMVSHTTIVFTRYITLEWIRRRQNDQKTYGELFYMFCDDIQDMDLTNALQSLMALFVNITTDISAEITSMIKSKVSEWMSTQALFIQALFGELCWES